jgi:PAS domain S-box-containing protein
MTLKVKVVAGYLLVNVASALLILAVSHIHAEPTGFLIAIGFGNISLTILLGLIFLRHVAVGVDRIARAVRLASSGDLSYRLPDRGNGGGLALLADAFNGMAEKLEKKIRELEVSEEKYSTLVENANDGIVIIEDQKYVFANRAFAKIMGYSKDELVGMDYLKIVAPESVEPLKERHMRRLQGFDVPTITEATFVDRNGQARYFEVNASLIGHDDRKAVLVIFRDVTDNKEYERNLKRLSEQVLRTQEEERKRISRELHDEIGQALAAMSISVDVLLHDDGRVDDRVSRRLQDVKKLIEKSTDDVHRISYDLRPYLLDNFGLVPALRWYTDAFTERTGVEVGLQIEGEWQKLSPALETTVYRVIQEALTNISKYAGAKRAFILLSAVSRGIELAIEDDGRGFATEPVQRKGGLMKGGLGLFGIGERVSAVGGSFSIASKAGMGTKLVITIPVPREHSKTGAGYDQNQDPSC